MRRLILAVGLWAGAAAAQQTVNGITGQAVTATAVNGIAGQVVTATSVNGITGQVVAGLGGAGVVTSWSGGGTASATLTIGVSPTAGHSLVVGIATYTTAYSVTSVLAKDSGGSTLGTFSADVSHVVPSGADMAMHWYHLSGIPAGVASVVVTASGGGAYIAAICLEVMQATLTLDVADTAGAASSTGTTWSSVSMTPAAGVSELVLALAVNDTDTTAFTVTAPYTGIGGYADSPLAAYIIAGYQQLASTSGSYAVTGTKTSGKKSLVLGVTYR